MGRKKLKLDWKCKVTFILKQFFLAKVTLILKRREYNTIFEHKFKWELHSPWVLVNCHTLWPVDVTLNTKYLHHSNTWANQQWCKEIFLMFLHTKKLYNRKGRRCESQNHKGRACSTIKSPIFDLNSLHQIELQSIGNVLVSQSTLRSPWPNKTLH